MYLDAGRTRDLGAFELRRGLDDHGVVDLNVDPVDVRHGDLEDRRPTRQAAVPSE